MFCIRSFSNDPFFNLALEEHLLKSSEEEYFIVYSNRPTVIIGKHQIPFAEANIEFLKAQGIRLARRISGGGAVYHDQGNLNYAFIRNISVENKIDYKMQLQPVVDVLHSMNMNAEVSSSHDLLIDGKKISGNAEHIYGNRVLHHGTLLFSSDIEMLKEALNPTGTYESKAVSSKRSSVARICDFVSAQMNFEMFSFLFFQRMINSISGEHRSLQKNDIETTSRIAFSKYAKASWVYGKSPDYAFSRVTKEGYESTISVRKGIINEVELNINSHSLSDVCLFLKEKIHHILLVDQLMKEFKALNLSEKVWRELIF
ncbi:MAG: biotin/lipoate A/B protein ligase family protein [Bacteroidota bacterium]